MKLRLLLAPSSLILAVVACSGASSTELFDPPGGSQLGTEPGPTNEDGSSGAISPGSSGSSGGSSGEGASSSSSSSSGASGSSSSGSTSGGSSSSGGTKDAGQDPPPPPPKSTIYCGGTKSCAAGAEICCSSWFGQGPPTYECEPAGFLACAAGTTIACDDQTDCPNGQVCCGTLQNNSGYTSVECKNKCTNLPGLRSVRFCDPKAAVDECLAAGMSCGPSQSLPGYYVCRS